ncbi:MAG: hypothetical protein IJU44_06605 [Kiritimatiellae bacterium]|nr:hypothetical protein [Kiritimatiellia bacterium]
MKLLDRVHARFGDFWWYSLCIFLALRLTDLVNAVIGLWLVPHYVPEAELGAVLPITHISTVFGLPISILVVTLTRYVNIYQTAGRPGKVKALLRCFWGAAAAAVVVGCAAAALLLPLFFERIRIVSGSLGVLIVASALLGTTAPVFTNALQGLKNFRAISFMNIFTAPIRLAVMLVTMPIRALSGYVLANVVAPLFQIVWSWFTLRNRVHSRDISENFWREDGRSMIRYTFLVALSLGFGTVATAVQTLIIRQRLPEIDSAAYYMISRFAEVASYGGVSLAMVMFPFASEANIQGRDSQRILRGMTFATLVFGGLCTVGLAVTGRWIFSSIPKWRPYIDFVPHMVLLSAVFTVTTMVNNFYSHESACSRFGFLWYSVPLYFAQSVVLVAFSGYTFFVGRLPDRVVEWMGSMHLNSLRNVLWVVLAFSMLHFVCAFTSVAISSRKDRRLA